MDRQAESLSVTIASSLAMRRKMTNCRMIVGALTTWPKIHPVLLNLTHQSRSYQILINDKSSIALEIYKEVKHIKEAFYVLSLSKNLSKNLINVQLMRNGYIIHFKSNTCHILDSSEKEITSIFTKDLVFITSNNNTRLDYVKTRPT